MGPRIVMVVAAGLFGLLGALARLATLPSVDGPGFHGGQLALVRFLISVALCGVVFVARPRLFQPHRRRLLVTRGLLGGAAVLLYFLALERVPAGEATLLNNTSPIIATALGVLTLGERPTIHLALALAITTVGVFLVLGGGAFSFHLGSGELFGIGAACLSGGAITSIRALRAPDQDDPGNLHASALMVFFAFSSGGAVVCLPFALTPWPHASTAWFFAVAASLVSVVAQLAMTHAFGHLTLPEGTVWQQLTPAASYLWAVPLLGEGITGPGSAGVAMVLAGVAYGALLGHKKVILVLTPYGDPHRAATSRET